MNTDSLVRLTDLFAAHAGLKRSTISTYAANDGKLIDRLDSGQASCTIRRAKAVCQWFSDNWPNDLAWPRDISRPSKSPRSKEAA